MSRPVVVIAGRHRPHELVLLGLSLTSGLAYLLGAPPPQSAAAQMPPWLVAVWAAGLAVSGGVGLASVLLLRRWRDAALLAEAGAMLIGAGALVLLVAAIIAVAGMKGTFGIGFCAAWSLANVARAWQLRKELRQ